MRTSDIDTALAALTDAKTSQAKIAACLAEIDRLRHRKPVEKLYTKPPAKVQTKQIRRVIIPDSHGNMIARHAAAAMLRDIKRIDPDEIIMLGDHLDCGGFLAQNQVLGFVAEAATTGFAEDVEACNQFLDQIILAAPGARIEYLEGNHCRRIERWCITQSLRHVADAEFLYSLIGPEAVLKLKERGINYYRQSVRYDGLPVEGVIQRGKCLFTHGWSTARAAATAHAQKAGMSIVYGHTHRSQSEIKRTVAGGVFCAWCPGCLSQLQSYYEHGDPNDHTHGYAIQLVEPSGNFLHLQIPIIDGESLLHGVNLSTERA
jgi:predicted phosphodiesterase